MKESIIMPKELTAENGAKGLLIGEFYEEIDVRNPEHCGCEECQDCEGPITFKQKIPISWTNIKAIYKKAAEHLALG